MNKIVKGILKALLATILYIIGIELLGSWYYVAEAIKFENYISYYILIQGVLQLFAVVTFLYFVNKRTFKDLIRSTHYRWYILALVLGFSFVFIQTPLNNIYNFLFGADYEIAYRYDGLPKFKNVNVLSTVLFIPIGEELFFRRFIQSNLQNRLKASIAIIIASFSFALIHSPYLNWILESSDQDWHLFYLTIFGGVISGLLFYRSNSVGPSIIFHIFWNLMVLIV